MDDQQSTWHIGPEAIYDYLDHRLTAQAMAASAIASGTMKRSDNLMAAPFVSTASR